MATKWTIRKCPIRRDGSRALYPWFVFCPGVIPPEEREIALVLANTVFHTFPQALAYVERQTRKARTVEVELPNTYTSGVINHEDLGDDWSVMVSSGNVNAVIRTIHGVVRIRNENLKPLAEYLLALHYEKENQ